MIDNLSTPPNGRGGENGTFGGRGQAFFSCESNSESQPSYWTVEQVSINLFSLFSLYKILSIGYDLELSRDNSYKILFYRVPRGTLLIR
jgi:hypothetical protein